MKRRVRVRWGSERGVEGRRIWVGAVGGWGVGSEDVTGRAGR